MQEALRRYSFAGVAWEDDGLAGLEPERQKVFRKPVLQNVLFQTGIFLD